LSDKIKINNTINNKSKYLGDLNSAVLKIEVLESGLGRKGFKGALKM
jgi:hypothetical protein